MNREDIIRMAHQSHLDVYGLGTDYAKFADALERFAALVAAAEQKAVLETIGELMGAERDRNPMFSDGYDYALGHLEQFVKGRQA